MSSNGANARLEGLDVLPDQLSDCRCAPLNLDERGGMIQRHRLAQVMAAARCANVRASWCTSVFPTPQADDCRVARGSIGLLAGTCRRHGELL